MASAKFSLGMVQIQVQVTLGNGACKSRLDLHHPSATVFHCVPARMIDPKSRGSGWLRLQAKWINVHSFQTTAPICYLYVFHAPTTPSHGGR